MSYDIELIDKNTKEVLQMNNPQFIMGGTFRAEYDSSTGKCIPAKQIEAHINITYNYGGYYYEATEGDSRFAWNDDGIVNYGIRGLYGKSAKESVDMILELIKRITEKYQKDGDWIKTKRIEKFYYDKNGNKIDDIIYAMMNGIEYTIENKEYEVSEGDTNNYWKPTAANAIKPLWDMAYMAMDNALNKNAIWSGD